MRRWFWILVCLMLVTIGAYALADVNVDSQFFPDENFRGYVLQFDTNSDGMLDDKELNRIQVIDCGQMNISSLQGIEYFPSVEDIYCNDNALTMLDVSKNQTLTGLNCSRNKLTGLDLSQNAALKYLTCDGNQLTALDLSHNPDLRFLYCNENSLKALDFSFHPHLELVECRENQLTELDVSNHPDLFRCYCGGNKELISADVSNTQIDLFSCYQGKLVSFKADHCEKLTRIDIYENKLTELDVSGCSALETLNCQYNQLISLDVSENTALKELDCFGNQLTSLNLGKKPALTMLWCGWNRLKQLDLSGCPALEELGCHGNELTQLNVSLNPGLKELWCAGNNISKIDVSACPFLVDDVKNHKRNTSIMILASGFASCDYFGQKIIPDEGVSNIIEIDSFTTIVAGSFVSAPKKEITEVEIVPISDQTYTGKAIKPKVTAKQDGRKLTEGKDYQITYQNNKNIGKATVILTGKGDYTGEIMADFHIVPKTVTLSALKSIKSNQLTVKWKKGSGITGYEIQYSLKKNFKNAEAITIDKAKTTSVTIPELKSRKKYYVRIRAYKTVNGENYYSEWSKAMNQKVK